MTPAEKAGQMTQVANTYVKNLQDIATYGIGSILSGGGGGPNGQAGGTATQWADMVDNFQSYALKSRLGIPLLYGVDAVHGHNNVSGAVIFPHNIGLGASRDAPLVQQEEDVTRQEVLGTGIRWAFAPCVCVARDDRWGRTYESFGEDPSIGNPLAAAAVQGFQGSTLSPTSVLATAKHFVADGGTKYGTGSSGYLIDQGDAQISETDLRGIHQPPAVAAQRRPAAPRSGRRSSRPSPAPTSPCRTSARVRRGTTRSTSGSGSAARRRTRKARATPRRSRLATTTPRSSRTSARTRRSASRSSSRGGR
jgi:beta-glucosidase